MNNFQTLDNKLKSLYDLINFLVPNLSKSKDDYILNNIEKGNHFENEASDINIYNTFKQMYTNHIDVKPFILEIEVALNRLLPYWIESYDRKYFDVHMALAFYGTRNLARKTRNSINSLLNGLY